MLEVEYAQAAETGVLYEPAHRARLSRSSKRGWMFALGTEANGTVWGGAGLDRMKQRFSSAPEPASLGVFLSQLIANAHRRYQLSALVACSLRFDRVVIARAGPAYCYVLRNNFATLLTFDRVEVTDYQLRAGDVLLMCTERHHGSMKGSELAEIAGRSTDLSQAASQLALRAHGPLLMIRVRAVQGKPPASQSGISAASAAL